ncbi:unknown [Clostridium sp. CAG:58]|nr:unknown [Clostridium sp. CAG:58]
MALWFIRSRSTSGESRTMLTFTFGWALWKASIRSGKMEAQMDSMVPMVRAPVSSWLSVTAALAQEISRMTAAAWS